MRRILIKGKFNIKAIFFIKAKLNNSSGDDIEFNTKVIKGVIKENKSNL